MQFWNGSDTTWNCCFRVAKHRVHCLADAALRCLWRQQRQRHHHRHHHRQPVPRRLGLEIDGCRWMWVVALPDHRPLSAPLDAAFFLETQKRLLFLRLCAVSTPVR